MSVGKASGLCSYLLIGYYIKRDEARRAAKKAFVMNRIGDWGVLMAMFLIFTLTGSISFFDKTVDGVQVQSVFSGFRTNVAAIRLHWGAIFAGGIDFDCRSFIYRRDGKIGADSAFDVAAGRDGWSDSGFGFDSRGDDGYGGRLSGRAL